MKSDSIKKRQSGPSCLPHFLLCFCLSIDQGFLPPSMIESVDRLATSAGPKHQLLSVK